MVVMVNACLGLNAVRMTTSVESMQIVQQEKAVLPGFADHVSAHRFFNPFVVLMAIPTEMTAKRTVPELPSLAKGRAHHQTATMPVNVSMAHGVKPRTVRSVGKALCLFVLPSTTQFLRNAALHVQMPMATESAMWPTPYAIWTMFN